MQLDERSVRRIIDEVWNLVSKAHTEACGHERNDCEGALVSWVEVSGPWEGAVAVRCSHSLARLLAARAHDLEGAEPTEAQIDFALGAIAQLIGLNVNGLLSAPARVSRPLVFETRASGASHEEVDTAPGSTTWLRSLGHPFSVTVSLRARAA
jgi:hypothetical protein